MSLNVLVVDDEEIIRKAIIKSLKKCGLQLDQVFEAGNGQAGLEIIRKNQIDFALIDFNMPVMDGGQMLERLRRDPETKDMPVVVITGEKNPEAIYKVSRNKVGIIEKPFSPETLGEVVMDLIS